jgi:hypothetical protein
MKSLSDRVVDVLRWSEGEWLSAVDVTRRLGMNTAVGGQLYIDAIAIELCIAVDAGMAVARPTGASGLDCRYQLKEATS